MSASLIRMTPIQDPKHRDQWLLFCEGCDWRSVEINRTTADIAIRRESAAHVHDLS